MDTATLEQQAQSISQQYLQSLPTDYATKHSTIADPDTLTVLFKAVQTGLNDRDSALAAGISTRTWQRWMQLGEEQPDSAYGVFVAHIKASRAQGKHRRLEKIEKHGEKEWTALAWMLERTDPEQFALRKDTDNSPRIIVQVGVNSDRVEVNVLGAEQGQLPQDVVVGAEPR